MHMPSLPFCLFLSLLLVSSCKSVRQSPVDGSPSSTSLPLDEKQARRVAFLAGTGQLIVSFANDAEMEGIEEPRLALGGANIRNIAVSLDYGNYTYTKGLSAGDFLQKIDQDLVAPKVDALGNYSRFHLEGDLAKSDIDFLQTKALRERHDLVAIHHSSYFGQGYVDIRKVADIDQNTRIRDPRSGGDVPLQSVVADFKRDLGDPLNPLHKQETFNLNLSSKVDADIVVARLQVEFGNKYSFKRVGRNRIVAAPFEESYEIRLLQDGRGRPLAGMSNQLLQKALKKEEFLAPGAATIIIGERGTIRWQEINQKDLYEIAEVDLAKLPPGVRPNSKIFGRRDMAAYLVVRRGAAPAVTLEPFAQAGKESPEEFLEAIDDLAENLARGAQYRGPRNIDETTLEVGEVIDQSFVKNVTLARRGNELFAHKTNYIAGKYRVANEMSYAIVLGGRRIAPEVHVARVEGRRSTYLMEYVGPDALKKPMSQEVILSYAKKQMALRELGLVSLDDHPGNILIRDNPVAGKNPEALLTDFEYIHRHIDGQRPALNEFGAFAPKEAMSVHADLPGYSAGKLQSFYFAMSTLRSRLGPEAWKAAMASAGAKTSHMQVDVIDGSVLAKNLAGGHAEARMSPDAYNMLLEMLDNNYQARPSVDSFVNIFSNKVFTFDD